jgi:hypothetical protein
MTDLVGANNHSPSSAWADTRSAPTAITSIVIAIVGAKLVFARKAEQSEASSKYKTIINLHHAYFPV